MDCITRCIMCTVDEEMMFPSVRSNARGKWKSDRGYMSEKLEPAPCEWTQSRDLIVEIVAREVVTLKLSHIGLSHRTRYTSYEGFPT